MRGKLRDKRTMHRDRLTRESVKREMIGRRPAKRDNRNLHLSYVLETSDDEYLLEKEGELVVTEEQQN